VAHTHTDRVQDFRPNFVGLCALGDVDNTVCHRNINYRVLNYGSCPPILARSEWVFDPRNVSVTLDTTARAARALGKRLIIRVADVKAKRT
jgi:hypothetical protein